jgi:glyoxylase-like metal-dependent hydrolase (beta-lactamase superfamily II)
MRLPGSLIVFASLFFSALASGAEPAAVRLMPVKVSERVWYVQGLPGVASPANQGYNSNAGFVVTPDGVLVVDALGTPALGRELVRAIRSVTDAPIRRVIVTHYHADHFYGLAAFKREGAEVWSHGAGREYLESGEAAARLEQRRRDLAPWADDMTALIAPDRWLEGDISFVLGGVTFDLIHMGPAHAPDDLVVVVRNDQVLFSGDILFSGRVPFVGNADSKRWLATMDRLLDLKPAVMVPGHGPVSRNPAADLQFTREYLRYLRQTMGRAVEDMLPFEEAYAQTDWKRFEKVPAFEAANRVNAYGTYLLMERESLEKK